MNMKERIARAIAEELDKREMLLADPLTLRRMLSELCATAALDALAEPTPKQIRAMWSVFEKCIAETKNINGEDFFEIYRAAIKAARG